MNKPNNSSSSWEQVSDWYDRLVGKEGHYYHQNVVIPRLLAAMNLQKDPSLSLLDLACGQGILARHLPSFVNYWGVDLSPSLIQSAKKQSPHSPRCHFVVGDITHPLRLEKKDFSHATLILALQSISEGSQAIQNAHHHLCKGGKLWIVLNHPCFRVPRQSSWEVDRQNKIQYRRIQSYLSPLQIPIQTKPSKQGTASTVYSFHHSLSDYSQWLYENGFVIERIEEWISDKTSEGGASRMENRCRKEFPLFLTLVAQKK